MPLCSDKKAHYKSDYRLGRFILDYIKYNYGIGTSLVPQLNLL